MNCRFQRIMTIGVEGETRRAKVDFELRFQLLMEGAGVREPALPPDLPDEGGVFLK